jgi:hypothetical protein
MRKSVTTTIQEPTVVVKPLANAMGHEADSLIVV